MDIGDIDLDKVFLRWPDEFLEKYRRLWADGERRFGKSRYGQRMLERIQAEQARRHMRAPGMLSPGSDHPMPKGRSQ